MPGLGLGDILSTFAESNARYLSPSGAVGGAPAQKKDESSNLIEQLMKLIQGGTPGVGSLGVGGSGGTAIGDPSGVMGGQPSDLSSLQSLLNLLKR